MKKGFAIEIRKKIKNFNKIISVDPDKSLTHRFFFIAANSSGISQIKGLDSDDIKVTINGLRKLGVKITKKKNTYNVYGNGIGSFQKYNGKINCSNSGTSIRSFLGLLACFPYSVTLTGDNSLSKRPFKRLTNYIEKIGAVIIHPKNKKNTLPIKIHGTSDWPLAQKHYIKLPSAQLKTALIYSALQTPGVTEIIEFHKTRDHTERILKYLNADIREVKTKNKKIIYIRGNKEINNFSVKVPADPSSASFFVAQTLLAKKSSLLLKNVCVNDTRIGFIKILQLMGAKIKIKNKKEIFNEPVGDIYVQSSNLRGIKCPKELIVKSIDELPMLFCACALAKKQSTFTNIEELRFKESDRIASIEKGLKLFGVRTKSTKNTLKIYGNPNLKPKRKIKISSNLDHRIAMSFFVLGQVLGANLIINNFETVNSSFPNFLQLQKKIGSKWQKK